MSAPKNRIGASSFDDALFSEVEALISGVDSGVPENFDDYLLGQDPKNNAEENFQRGQEVANTIATLGWQYIVESFHKKIDEYKRKKDNAEGDTEIIESHRRWKVAQEIVEEILRNVQSAAEVPHPEDLPR